MSISISIRFATHVVARTDGRCRETREREGASARPSASTASHRVRESIAMDERETDDDDALDFDSFPNRRRRRRRLDVGEEAETRRANGEDARARAMPSSDDALRSLMSYEDEEEEEAEALPAGWRRARDAKSGRGYYYNKRAKQSSWTRPVETRAEGGETRDATVGSGGVSTVKDERAEAEDDGANANVAAAEEAEEEAEEAEAEEEDARALARRVVFELEARCENVAARALATPRAVLRYREAMDVLARRHGTDGESVDAKADVERMREIERGLDEDAREYEEWIREAETETKAVEAETKAEAHIEDALVVAQALDEASTEVDARAQRTIARPPAPPLPKNERAPAPPAPSAPVVKRKRLAVSNARRHKGDMEKWAKVRESEKIVGEGASAIKAKQAKEAEEWRVQQLVDGVDGSTNPNFVPVGDWRARVRAASENTKLEQYRTRREEKVKESSKQKCEGVPTQKETPLPPDWREFVDEASGDRYYGNVKTQETTWERPT